MKPQRRATLPVQMARATKPDTAKVLTVPIPKCDCGGAISFYENVVVPPDFGDDYAANGELVGSWCCTKCSKNFGIHERCPEDGHPVTFDPSIVGESVGGLALRGWNRCNACGGIWISRQAKPEEAKSEGWRVASSGVSLDAGAYRVRIEAGQHSRAGAMALIKRIARVPELEAVLATIASIENVGDPAEALAEVIALARGVIK